MNSENVFRQNADDQLKEENSYRKRDKKLISKGKVVGLRTEEKLPDVAETG